MEAYYGDLEGALKEHLLRLKLQPMSWFIEKIIQVMWAETHAIQVLYFIYKSGIMLIKLQPTSWLIHVDKIIRVNVIDCGIYKWKIPSNKNNE